MMIIDRIYNYFERNPQLHVLFIFDRMGVIENDLMGVLWREEYKYEIFNGAWFATKFDIETIWADKKVVLLFSNDTLPQTEADMLKFPLLDMLKANMEYKDDDYASFRFKLCRTSIYHFINRNYIASFSESTEI